MSWFSTDIRKLNQASVTVSPLLGLDVLKMDKIELRYKLSNEKVMTTHSSSLFASTSLVDDYLAQHESTDRVFNEAIVSGRAVVSGAELVVEHFDPMIEWIYTRIRETVAASTIGEDEAKLYIG